jgi:hypothetical protein
MAGGVLQFKYVKRTCRTMDERVMAWKDWLLVAWLNSLRCGSSKREPST